LGISALTNTSIRVICWQEGTQKKCGNVYF